MRHYYLKEKLDLLKLVADGWSVTNACIYFGIKRATYYRWKKKHEKNGELGLKRLKDVARRHVSRTESDVEDKVIELSISHAEDGCCKIAEALVQRGENISSPTVQKILKRAGLGKKYERLYRLEKLHVVHQQPITAHQEKLISKIDPAFKHRSMIGGYPGEVLVQDTFPIFDLQPSLYVFVIIDTYSYYAFAFTSEDKTAKKAKDLLKLKALKFFHSEDLSVKKVMTSKGREFTQYNSEYAKFLKSHLISHDVYSGKSKNWHGYIEKYKKETLDQLKRLDLSNAENVKQFIRELNNDNKRAARNVHGFPTFGESPLAILHRFKSTQAQSDDT